MNSAKPKLNTAKPKPQNPPELTKNFQPFYDFKVNTVKVKVLFSQKPAAPTIESALVNIAIRKSG